MNPNIGPDCLAAVVTVAVVEEKVVATQPPRGRLPMRSALLRPAETVYTPPLMDSYWSR